ncbi:hypothetical protein EXVG_00479 [Emiliania huxleyi virus 202]|nr:hypothetical protein EXVG_00479 [Emiliania huxleyi virus 202]
MFQTLKVHAIYFICNKIYIANMLSIDLAHVSLAAAFAISLRISDTAIARITSDTLMDAVPEMHATV